MRPQLLAVITPAHIGTALLRQKSVSCTRVPWIVAGKIAIAAQVEGGQIVFHKLREWVTPPRRRCAFLPCSDPKAASAHWHARLETHLHFEMQIFHEIQIKLWNILCVQTFINQLRDRDRDSGKCKEACLVRRQHCSLGWQASEAILVAAAAAAELWLPLLARCRTRPLGPASCPLLPPPPCVPQRLRRKTVNHPSP